eukprot:753571-Hanusia_phi.AAC.8
MSMTVGAGFRRDLQRHLVTLRERERCSLRERVSECGKGLGREEAKPRRLPLPCSSSPPLTASAAPQHAVDDSPDQHNKSFVEFLEEFWRDNSTADHALSKIAEASFLQSVEDVQRGIMDKKSLDVSDRITMLKDLARSDCTVWGKIDSSLRTSLQSPKRIPQDFPSLSVALGRSLLRGSTSSERFLCSELLQHSNRTLCLHVSGVQESGRPLDTWLDQMFVPKHSSLHLTSDRELNHCWLLEANSSGAMLGVRNWRQEEEDVDFPSFCVDGRGWSFDSCSLQSENGTVIMAQLEVL